MRKELPIEDHEPWYRQFWPWFLILLPASVVVAGLVTVFIASKGADDLVVDEYYKDGLAINRVLEKQQRANDLKIAARVQISGRDIRVLTRGPVKAESLKLSLSHPLESDLDFEVALVRSIPGEYLGRASRDIGPRWHWSIVPSGDGNWRLDGSTTESDFTRR